MSLETRGGGAGRDLTGGSEAVRKRTEESTLLPTPLVPADLIPVMSSSDLSRVVLLKFLLQLPPLVFFSLADIHL